MDLSFPQFLYTQNSCDVFPFLLFPQVLYFLIHMYDLFLHNKYSPTDYKMIRDCHMAIYIVSIWYQLKMPISEGGPIWVEGSDRIIVIFQKNWCILLTALYSWFVTNYLIYRYVFCTQLMWLFEKKVVIYMVIFISYPISIRLPILAIALSALMPIRLFWLVMDMKSNLPYNYLEFLCACTLAISDWAYVVFMCIKNVMFLLCSSLI